VLLDYLIKTYGQGEPIFLADVSYKDMKPAMLRQTMSKLVEKGQLRRFDKGIYYIPDTSIFPSGAFLSNEKVIERRYLSDKDQRCGYISGQNFANQFGLTTQVPMSCTVVSNKATTKERRIKLGKQEIILRQPRCTITKQNFLVLQILDLLADVDRYSEIGQAEARQKFKDYFGRTAMGFCSLEQYLSYYPIKIFKNMYEMGLLYGVPA
jgi:hypothetical protein